MGGNWHDCRARDQHTPAERTPQPGRLSRTVKKLPQVQGGEQVQPGRELGALRTDLDDGTATLLALSAANWAYTWLRPESDTDELADRFYDFLLDGMRGYVTPSP